MNNPHNYLIIRQFLILLSILLTLILAAAFYLGTIYISPRNSPISAPPASWQAKTIRFKNNRLAGWYVPGPDTSRCILLLHGFNSHREAIIPIGQFLRDAGFSLFLFDFRGHGESAPDTITFGLRESEDAQAAFDWIKKQTSCKRIGIWGQSMGGAAAILGKAPLPAQAFVFDSMYSTIERATQHRILNVLGHPFSDIMSPLLIAQIPWRLGTPFEAMHPIEAITRVSAPTLIIYGSEDRSAYPEEAHAIYKASLSKNKEIWEVRGAHHGTTHSVDPNTYSKKVVSFFNTYL